MNHTPEKADAPKSLSELLAGLLPADDLPQGLAVTAIATDSRLVTEGAVFVAIAGYETDGHRYIADAIGRGACAVVCQDAAYLSRVPAGVPVFVVSDSRRAAATMAARFYDHPSRKLTIVAVTGTSGKTTTALLIDSIFRAAGHKTGVIGTLGARIGDRNLPGDRTTPDSVELQELLSQMVSEGVTYVSMEVSSHALYLDRTWGMAFDGAVFTNLSQDHLDFHADLDEYFEAKLRLFTEYPELSRPGKELVGATNLDDCYGQRLAERARCRVVKYGVTPEAQVRAVDLVISPAGVGFTLVAPPARMPVALKLSGAFNIHNALAAAACTLGLGVPIKTVVRGLEGLAAVPGRFERVNTGGEFAVVVDYAHKPDALEKVIRSVRALNPRRVICLMGCGGDRDRDKRPKMGKIATRDCDFTIITSDNPRTEDPMSIIGNILAGVEEGCPYAVEPDRRAAIFAGVGMCEAGDIFLICGKGHETYQVFKDRTIHFDDREVAREALAAATSSGA
jgi:UDP-N-acetylmuramoyl-L-alanyl-D-glutamate--2,6-diaminopimelate ligase